MTSLLALRVKIAVNLLAVACGCWLNCLYFRFVAAMPSTRWMNPDALVVFGMGLCLFWIAAETQ